MAPFKVPKAVYWYVLGEHTSASFIRHVSLDISFMIVFFCFYNMPQKTSTAEKQCLQEYLAL